MENSGKFFVPPSSDDQPQWFVAQGEKWMGPLRAAEVYEKILSQEISWAHYIWKAGQSAWKRICDVKTFQSAVPTPPAVKPTAQQVKAAVIPAPPRAAASVAIKWYVHDGEGQYGPFESQEILRLVSVGKFSRQSYVWNESMTDWKLLGEVPELSTSNSKKPPAAPRASAAGAAARTDKRRAPRKPLVAKILMSNDNTVISAVCRDISVGGMQVLTDQIPGDVGTNLKLNITPAGAARTPAFVAQGVIVRILEDRRGFSFRFDPLSPETQKAITTYIHSAS